MVADPDRGNPTAVGATPLGGPFVEARQIDRDQLLMPAEQREGRIGGAQLEVPAAKLLLVAMTHRSVWDRRFSRGSIEDHRLPFGLLHVGSEVGRAQESVRNVGILSLAKGDQHR